MWIVTVSTPYGELRPEVLCVLYVGVVSMKRCGYLWGLESGITGDVVWFVVLEYGVEWSLLLCRKGRVRVINRDSYNSRISTEIDIAVEYY